MGSDARAGTLSDLAQINPRRRIVKGATAPFIEMAALPLSGRDVDPALVQHRRAKGAGAHFQDGDTLLARITPCLENGKTAQVRGLGSHIVGEGSTEFIVLCGRDPADNDFVYYLCRDPEFRQFAIARMEGTSGRQRVAWQSIAEYPFHPPSAVDRRSASEMLSALDDRIDNLRATNTTLEAIAHALFKSWFVDFDPVHAKAEGRAPAGMDAATAALFPSEFEDSELGPIPKGWRLGSLRDICTVHDSTRIPLSAAQREKRRGRFPYYGAASVMDYVDGYLFDGVYVLLAEDGSVATKSGFALTQYVWGQFWVNNHAHVLAGAHGCSTEQLLLMLQRVRIGEYITGAVQGKLSQRSMFRIPAALPPGPVYGSFADVVQPIFDAIRLNSGQMDTFVSLRDTLLPRLISGKLRLPDAAAEIAAAGA